MHVSTLVLSLLAVILPAIANGPIDSQGHHPVHVARDALDFNDHQANRFVKVARSVEAAGSAVTPRVALEKSRMRLSGYRGAKGDWKNNGGYQYSWTITKTVTRSNTASTKSQIRTSTTKLAASSTKPPSSSSKPPTSSKPSSTPSNLPSPSAPSSGSLTAFQQDILKAHNTARSARGAIDLTWNDSLTASAQAWADKCVWEHGGANGAGQNLASAASTAVAEQSGSDAVAGWMSEEKLYDPSNPTYSHFIQVVWKSTTQLGCAQSRCSDFRDGNGNLVFDSRYKSVVFTVCNYSPAGNFAGQFGQNVQKAA